MDKTNFMGRGIIPAYAGNTWYNHVCCSAMWDHPRVCGEHIGYDSLDPGSMGSSPRMRGTLKSKVAVFISSRIIPAYAGNTASFLCNV